jgi:hypothetical protein
MTGSVSVRQYRFLSLNLAISGSHALVDAMHARLRYFPAADGPADLRFEFLTLREGGAHVTRPVGQSRRLSPNAADGFITEYFAERDELYVSYQDRVAAVCEIAKGLTRVSIAHPESVNLWIATHPMFVIPLFEILKRHRYFNLHAAGLCVGDKALLVAGHSGSGKSTLAIALCRAGFGFMSDDYVFLTRGPNGVAAHGFPEEIDLLDGTAVMFPELAPMLGVEKRAGWSKRHVRIEDYWDVRVVRECTPTLAVFPRVVGTGASVIERMDPQAALAELVSNIQFTKADSGQEHLDLMGDLVRGCACYTLKTGQDLDVLPQMLRTLLGTSPGVETHAR